MNSSATIPPPAKKLSCTYADVILPFHLEKAFTYLVPPGLERQVSVGKRVMIPFGKKKIYSGLIADLHQHEPKEYKPKTIIDILDEQPVFSRHHFTFWKWVASYYCSTIGEVMATALPANLKLASETCILIHPRFEGEVDDLTNDEYIIANALAGKEWLSLQEVSGLVGKTNIFPLIQSLLMKEVILLKENIRQKYKPKLIHSVQLSEQLQDNESGLKQVFSELEKNPKQLNLLLNFLMMEKENPVVEKKELLKKAGLTESVLQTLVKKKVLQIVNLQTDRIHFNTLTKEEFELSEIQQHCLDNIKLQFNEKKAVLLHGVTGSGKTNIYASLIQEVIQEGRQVLYLVPEISLTAQLITRLRNYFGEVAGIYHSRYSDNERVETFFKVVQNEYKLILGSRSSLFLPFRNLGLIIIDEEHETSYKQSDPAPRYHARDAAVYLAASLNIPVLLGSATPSFESFYNSRTGKYGYVRLDKRYGEVLPPKIKIVDLKTQRKQNLMKSNFSSVLLTDMKKVISEKKQVILFQNRRGYSPSLECRSCGWSPGCENCDITLTYHKAANVLRCHYCGFHQQILKKCKACGTGPLFMRGFGTEKIEDEIPIFFPEASTLRLDMDSTRGKNSLQRIVAAFEKGDTDILVGTQMVSKGLDFENVKLIGIMNADQMLFFPDFRANERSFQLMMQVSGRAGRRKEQGEVVIQTSSPDHPVFMHLINNSYEDFYSQEMMERINYNYPPATKLVKIILKEKELKTVTLAANHLADKLKNNFGPRVLGPEAPLVPRVRNRYIMNILLKFERQFTVQEAKKFILAEIEALKYEKDYRRIHIIVDIDPAIIS